MRTVGLVTGEEITREVDVINKLSKHENLVDILDNGWLAGTSSMYYIDMELCAYSLAEYIKDLKHVTVLDSLASKQPTAIKSLKHIMEILRQIANGLRYIHGKELLHGNLKPTNGIFACRDR